MNPNNNLSVLPFYTSIEQQNARRWWVYGRIYPLFAPAHFLLPFQILGRFPSEPQIDTLELYTKDGEFVGMIPTILEQSKVYDFDGLYAIVYSGKHLIIDDISNGQYYIRMEVIWEDGEEQFSQFYYSEIFTVVNDIEPYLKIEWWDSEDLVFDAGRIVYKNENKVFHQVLYLDSDIAKPEYIFEEEGETRDGYYFPIKQISEKRYKFNFLASEYLLDVMRFIRMADYVKITYHGQVYYPDTFLITPEWESNGDVAVVSAEFDTDTVVKKLGRGFTIPTGHDFTNDYNDDFDIEPINN